MIKMRTRIGSIVLAVAMLLTLLPVTAFADGTDQTVSPVQVDSFEKLQNAQTAVEGSIIEVSGNITMEQPVTFTNKVTLKRKRQTWDRVDRYERIVVERIEAFHHY